jgi:hypothetical protein
MYPLDSKSEHDPVLYHTRRNKKENLRGHKMAKPEQIAKNKERILNERAKRIEEYGYVRLPEL